MRGAAESQNGSKNDFNRPSLEIVGSACHADRTKTVLASVALENVRHFAFEGGAKRFIKRGGVTGGGGFGGESLLGSLWGRRSHLYWFVTGHRWNPHRCIVREWQVPFGSVRLR